MAACTGRRMISPAPCFSIVARTPAVRVAAPVRPFRFCRSDRGKPLMIRWSVCAALCLLSCGAVAADDDALTSLTASVAPPPVALQSPPGLTTIGAEVVESYSPGFNFFAGVGGSYNSVKLDLKQANPAAFWGGVFVLGDGAMPAGGRRWRLRWVLDCLVRHKVCSFLGQASRRTGASGLQLLEVHVSRADGPRGERTRPTKDSSPAGDRSNAGWCARSGTAAAGRRSKTF